MIIELDKHRTTIIASPDTVGAFPIRQDITVLPPDDPSKLRLGWKVYEYLGVEIYPYDPDVQNAEEVRKKCKPITAGYGLEVGQSVFVGTLDGWTVATICRTDKGELYADGKGCIFSLEFGKDDRHCWVSTCQISKSLITKLEI